jgi:membrane-associated phospholipid phosphatase
MGSGARADDPSPRPPLRWDPAWTHAGVLDYSLAAGGLAVLGLETILLQGRSEPARWNGPILFDTQARSLFRLSSESARAEAADVSWGFWFALVGYPLVVDVPHAWARYGKDVAWDLFWQDATALSLSAVADFALRDTVDRVRPYNTTCLDQGGSAATCLNGPEATRSFPSGHVSETTTGTALICTQHLKLHLYGGSWDEITCGSAVVADAVVASLRMMADDHWASDVLGGAAIGFAFGWGVPVLMHLHGHTTPAPATGSMPMLVAPVPMAFSRGGGLGLTGLF